MQRKVTIKVDEEVLRWARRKAADENTSVSLLVGQMLAEKMRLTDEYWQANERFKKLMTMPAILDGAGMSRDEMHQRGR